MNVYPTVKAVHVACVVATICLFALRGVWMLAAPERLQVRWVRIVPHMIDTLLLASAIWLAVAIGNYPGTHAWLTAKVAGLVAYIVLGSVALRRGKSMRVRVASFVAALVVFAWIVSVAVTKSPWGFLPPA